MLEPRGPSPGDEPAGSWEGSSESAMARQSALSLWFSSPVLRLEALWSRARLAICGPGTQHVLRASACDT